jgi:hypothetical protein
MSLTGDVSAVTVYGTTVSDQITVTTIDFPSLLVRGFYNFKNYEFSYVRVTAVFSFSFERDLFATLRSI